MMPSGLAARTKSDASLRRHTFTKEAMLFDEDGAFGAAWSLYCLCGAVLREFHHLILPLSNINIAATVSNETMTYFFEIDMK
jgi:hypothetical protein